MTDPRRDVRVLFGSLGDDDAIRSAIGLVAWWSTRSGAPTPTVIAMHGGPRRAQLARWVRPTVVYDPSGWTVPRLAQRLRLRGLARRLRSADLRHRLGEPGPILVAEASGLRLLQWLGPRSGPVIARLHGELESLDDVDPVDRDHAVARVDRWLVGSDERIAELRSAGVPDDRIVRLDDLDVPPDPDPAPVDPDAVRVRLASSLGIDPDRPLVVGAGDADWWTTPDAFVRVAWELLRRPEAAPVQVLWVPGPGDDRRLWPLRHDLDHAGLADRVAIAGPDVAEREGVAVADVVIVTRLGGRPSTARREAARRHRPVVRFADDAGSASQGLAAQLEVTVPHLDVDAMVDAILARLADPLPRLTTPLDDEPTEGDPRVAGPPILDAIEALRPR